MFRINTRPHIITIRSRIPNVSYKFSHFHDVLWSMMNTIQYIQRTDEIPQSEESNNSKQSLPIF